MRNQAQKANRLTLRLATIPEIVANKDPKSDCPSSWKRYHNLKLTFSTILKESHKYNNLEPLLV